MDIEEAIVSALQFENKVRDHYYKAAESTNDPEGMRVFGALGTEEQGHVDYLESRLKAWRETGVLDAVKVTSTVPTREWMARGRAKMRRASFKRPYDNEIKMLKDALKLEEEISAHYHTLVGALDGDAQSMFQRFLEIEDAHIAIVQAEIDGLEQNNFWFDIREFDLEAG